MSQSSENKTFEDPIFIIFLFFGIIAGLLVFWYYVHEYVAIAYVYIRYVEILPLWLIGKYIDLPGVNESYEYIYKLCRPDPTSIVGLCTRNMGDVSIFEIMKSSILINLIISVFIMRRLLKYAKIVKTKHPKLKFRREHNVETFINEQKINHKHLNVFTKLNLIDKDLNDPIYGMLLTVRGFCYKNKLISGWSKCDDGSYIPLLDYRRTEGVLINQLGRLWTGNTLSELSESEIILLAVAIPRVAATDISLSDDEYKKSMQESENLLNKFWDLFGETLTPTIDTSIEQELIVRYYKKSEKVRNIFSKHAYVRTIIYGLITEARRLGVLSAADFGWMQFYDREMYSILSTMGRQTAFPEACAVLSHYLYEARMGEGYPEPLIDKSIEGIKYVITDIYKFTDEDIKNYNLS
ncbi:secretion/conjugation apparatus DotM-related subunit [Citrobacter freundii]|uniref:secretion/conjugation apparatus DotM-related subunit n=1 Tax=Citrobacter freundii TaxID=546 RepID=UPI001904C3A0|nr:type IV secretion system protein IcmP/DotM [Citrobacter freundii]MBJ8931587.1 type IV secretion system protein IcmP/DotM [Citrobacter freundii]